MNPLQEYPNLRRWCYRSLWGSGVFLGAVQAGYAVAEHPSPSWVKIALGVLAYVSVASNYTADRNVFPSTVIKADPPAEVSVTVSESAVTIEPASPTVSSEGVTYDGHGAPIYDAKHDRED